MGSSAKVDNAMNMFKMAKNMMGMNKAQNEASELEEEDNSQDKFFETVDKYAEQLSIVASAMDADYEGGDFCAGLTVGFEGRDIIKGKAMSMAKNMFMQWANLHNCLLTRVVRFNPPSCILT